LLAIGKHLTSKSKNDLAISLLSFFPDNLEILRKIQNALGDEYTTGILLSDLSLRMTKINKAIYAELVQIR